VGGGKWGMENGKWAGKVLRFLRGWDNYLKVDAQARLKHFCSHSSDNADGQWKSGAGKAAGKWGSRLGITTSSWPRH